MEEIVNLLTEIKKALIMDRKSALSLAEAAEYYNMSRNWLYMLVSKKKIPYHKRGTRVYFKKEEFEQWLLGNRVNTTDEASASAELYDYLKDN